MAKLVNGLQEKIKGFGGLVISTDTLNPEHLISVFLNVLEPGTDDVQEILYDRTLSKDEVCEYLWDLLESIEVEGYWFGSSDCDPACIGWFRIEED